MRSEMDMEMRHGIMRHRAIQRCGPWGPGALVHGAWTQLAWSL
jgi:hypothetical protein